MRSLVRHQILCPCVVAEWRSAEQIPSDPTRSRQTDTKMAERRPEREAFGHVSVARGPVLGVPSTKRQGLVLGHGKSNCHLRGCSRPRVCGSSIPGIFAAEIFFNTSKKKPTAMGAWVAD